MTDWNLLVERTKSLTLAGVAKAKDFGEIARLNLNTIGEEEKIKQAFIEIGMLYAELHENSPEAGYEEAFSKLAQAKENIRKNREAVANIKRERNISDDDLKSVVLPASMDDYAN